MTIEYLSASKLKEIALPAKLRCIQCQKWKHNGLFSNRQLNEVRRGNTRKLRCQGCTVDQREEMECEGPCSEVKSLDKFSKNARGAHGSHWCLECTDWKATGGPGVATGPIPGGLLAPDEELYLGRGGSAVQDGTRSESQWETETAEEDDGTDLLSNATAPGPAAWFNPPPPTTTTKDSSVVDKMSSLNINSRSDGYVPPHLRHLQGPSKSTSVASSVSNPYGSETQEKKPAPGVVVWDSVEEIPEPIHYESWDNKGNHHYQTRNPSITTPSISGGQSAFSTAGGAQVQRGSNVWRPAQRAALPRSAPAPAPAIKQAPQKVRYGIEGDSDSDDYEYC
ncbi:hypothetical protein HYALB_00010187 [Hymenoscyphus albidus]|uniref:Stc1 domain-containing protein n=1 Tax=Hymenoscyphus albidus TaxID=595503 RepID=A0A9N9LEI1_9HELO|nr:hypothetical protein HYALB_00010187 [Hymenoscyphus albidus]